MERDESENGEKPRPDDGDDEVDYMDREINILRPATPFMQANIRMIVVLFVVWAIFVFGPVTASLFFPELMTETRVLGGYPLNFFLTALVAPGAALGLAGVYAWYRDRLDDRFGVDAEGSGTDGATPGQ